MYTNRFIRLLAAILLLTVLVLVVQDAKATISPVASMDSATRSYTAWAKAAETGTVDSATRSYTAWAKVAYAEAVMVDSATNSYIAQAKALACSADAAYGLNLDSATRSYIAWGLALQAKNDIGALCS